MKLLLDEMLSSKIATQLQLRGYDVMAVTQRLDLRGRSDPEILAAAMAEGRAIVTENIADFRSLAAREPGRGRSHPTLIFTTNQRFPRSDPRTVGRVVSALLELLSAELPAIDAEYWLS